MADAEFVNGMIFKAPHENAPDFVKMNISIKREELIEWLSGRDGDWVNLQVKEAKSGDKFYGQVDTWEKKEG